MKLYEVTFNKYTNLVLRDCVTNDFSNDGEKEYKKLPEKVIIKEEDISEAMKYGNGICSMKYVGDLVDFN